MDGKLAQLAAYCTAGRRLLPLWWKLSGVCACHDRERCTRKHPLVKWQDPEPGQSGATADVAVVAEWHRRWPLADWAAVCDDFFVIDCDRKHGGLDTLRELDDNLPELLGVTRVQRTPDGGRQYLYRQPPERDVRTTPQGRLRVGTFALAGFEVKGLRQDGQPGSYVGVPPSAGRRWLNAQPVSEAPPLLLQAVRRAQTVATNGGSVAGRGEAFDWSLAYTPGAIPPGSQNPTLFAAACALRALGASNDKAVADLTVIVRAFVNGEPAKPWTDEHAVRMWEHVKRKYAAGRTGEITESQRTFVESALERWAR